MANNFAWNYILSCDNCPHRKLCPIVDGREDKYCGWEVEDYVSVMKSLHKEYTLNETSVLIAQMLIANMLVAKRGLRDLKFNGLTRQIETPEGGVIEVENPIKSGLHQEFNRIIWLLKELKLTPKEAAPQRRELNIKKLIVSATKDLSRSQADMERVVKDA